MSGRKYFLVFSLLLFGYFALIGYQKVLFYRPQSIHQWAQCDRASIAVNYLNNGFDFFHPQTHNIANGTGITGLEFPMLNFLAAIGYKIFGFHEYIYRLVVLFFFFTGVLMAYRIAAHFIQNKIFALLPPLLLAASPVLAYYGISFLPEPATLGLSLTAWYYFIKGLQHKSRKNTAAVLLLCTLASLIKITSLINPFAMAAFIFITKNENGFKFKLKKILPLILIVIPVASWYIYASWLNKEYHSQIFMLEMRPLSSLQEFKSVWSEILVGWWWRFYPAKYFALLLAASAVVLFFRKNIDRQLLLITALLYAGSFSFFILMFSQFRVHDYYIIPLIPAFFFHWVLLCSTFDKISLQYKPAYSFFILLAIVTGFTISDAKDHVRTSHKKTSWKYSAKTFDLYFFLEPELRKLNIQPGDGVVSVFDQSFNISLYLMNQKGITIGPRTPKDTVISIIRKSNLPYAILNNFNPQRFDPVMDSLKLGEKISEWNDLSIYRLPVTVINK